MRALPLAVPVACCVLFSVCAGAAAQEEQARQIQVDSVLITLIEQVEVPARETGVLERISVREGQLVEEGEVLANIDDKRVRLELDRAQIEFDIARRLSENDVKVRAAKKTVEVARAELKRANESVELYQKSISATEIDRLRLAAERSALEVEQSEEELKTARLTRDAKANLLELAGDDVERRQIVAPISGAVVQVNRHRGEWVKPGDTVLRILRIDRLRAEGFLNASQLTTDLTGRRVVLTVDLPGRPKAKFAGTLVFVSPEINPVNGQVRVWAEIENSELALRPGLKGALAISLEEPQAARREAE